VRKRKAVPALLLGMMLAAGGLRGQAVNLDDALRDMNVALNLPQNIEMIPIVDQDDLEYQLAFRITGGKYEVRISFFPMSSLVRMSGNGDIDRYVPLLSMGLLAAVSKESLYFCKTAELPGPTVRKEFGADSGMTALVNGNKSDFGKGYRLVAVAFLYKSGKGVVVVSFLYNEPRELNMESLEFSQAYYCFQFKEGAAK
jgi:hypothetical protein